MGVLAAVASPNRFNDFSLFLNNEEHGTSEKPLKRFGIVQLGCHFTHLKVGVNEKGAKALLTAVLRSAHPGHDEGRPLFVGERSVKIVVPLEIPKVASAAVTGRAIGED